MTDELKPCPFCGGEALIDGDLLGASWVICRECGASGAQEDSDAEAIAAWNRRAGQEGG